MIIIDTISESTLPAIAKIEAELFETHFVHLKLKPLTDEQQNQVVEQRLGSRDDAIRLQKYIRDRVPLGERTQA